MQQCVGIDLHRRRSVIVRMTPEGEVIEQAWIDNDPVALALEISKAGPNPDGALEAGIRVVLGRGCPGGQRRDGPPRPPARHQRSQHLSELTF